MTIDRVDGVFVAHDNNVEIASTRDAEWTRLSEVAARIMALAREPIAILGNGFGIVAGILPRSMDVDVYEMRAELAESCGHRLIFGDFLRTFPCGRAYALVFNDTGVNGSLCDSVILSGLQPDGMILN